MKYNLHKTDGILLKLLFRFLELVGQPLDWTEEKLQSKFGTISHRYIQSWNADELEGVFIELWWLFWLCVNLVLLYYISIVGVALKWILFIIILLRLGDFLRAFLAKNLRLTKYPLRSIGRSYVLLFLGFFEIAAISSSVQFLICEHFSLASAGSPEPANWQNVYYYSLRNMLTIGGGDLIYSACPQPTPFFLGIVRIAQPLFALLFVTLAINETLRWKETGNGTQRPSTNSKADTTNQPKSRKLKPNVRLQALLSEYQTGSSAYLSADNFPWQVGMVIIVAATILWGFVLTGDASMEQMSGIFSLISLIFSVWFLSANHNRQIYKAMLRRLVEIESEYEMEFHRRFWETRDLDKLLLPCTEYQNVLAFPRGHQLNFFFFLLGSLGGPVVAFISGKDAEQSLFLSLTIVLLTLIIAFISNSRSGVRRRNDKD